MLRDQALHAAFGPNEQPVKAGILSGEAPFGTVFEPLL
jgi:hypothetical protein